MSDQPTECVTEARALCDRNFCKMGDMTRAMDLLPGLLAEVERLEAELQNQTKEREDAQYQCADAERAYNELANQLASVEAERDRLRKDRERIRSESFTRECLLLLAADGDDIGEQCYKAEQAIYIFKAAKEQAEAERDRLSRRMKALEAEMHPADVVLVDAELRGDDPP